MFGLLCIVFVPRKRIRCIEIKHRLNSIEDLHRKNKQDGGWDVDYARK